MYNENGKIKPSDPCDKFLCVTLIELKLLTNFLSNFYNEQSILRIIKFLELFYYHLFSAQLYIVSL